MGTVGHRERASSDGPRTRAAHLEQLPRRVADLGQGVAERRPVVEGLAPDLGAAGVEVRVHVQDSEGPVDGGDGTHRGKRHRVISADDEGRCPGGDDRPHLRLDEVPHRRRVERREGHVAPVQRPDPAEDVDPVHRMKGLQQRAGAAEVVGRQPRPGLVGDGPVVGDAEQDRVGAGVGRSGVQVDHREPEERRLAVTEVLGRGLLGHQRDPPRSRSIRARTSSAQAWAETKARASTGSPNRTTAWSEERRVILQ